ncbi:MAG TPA: TA system VapC family ribonuclease toxin, partial [Ilumatobacteraceae bacterium]
LYAVDVRSPRHDDAARWLEATLNGDRRIALPWQTIGAFVRIATHPRVSERPLTGAAAFEFVDEWLACDPVWIPPTSERTARLLADLILRYDVTGNLVTDAQLAAIALEHGLTVLSTDTDFARFTEVRWENPLLR